jgi:hypothetical protein
MLFVYPATNSDKLRLMKVIGIEVKGSKVIFFALESINKKNVAIIPDTLTSLNLKDHRDCTEVRMFKDMIHNFFKSISPDAIAIIAKKSKGRFQASPISFKIEGLMQCYEAADVSFIDPITISAFKKKHNYEVIFEHVYQEDAANLAYYLIHRNE